MILPPFVGALAMRKLFSLYGGSVNLLLRPPGPAAGGLPAAGWRRVRGRGVAPVAAPVPHPVPQRRRPPWPTWTRPSPRPPATWGPGAGGVFRRITLPLMRPGLFAGGDHRLHLGFTDVGTPLIVGLRPTCCRCTIFKDLASLADPGARRTPGLRHARRPGGALRAGQVPLRPAGAARWRAGASHGRRRRSWARWARWARGCCSAR